MAKRSTIKATKLGTFVKERRTQLDLTSKEVADQAGLPQSAISRIESGFHTHPSPRTLEAIATVLDVSLLDLLVEAGLVPKGSLPSLVPYLRTKYDLPDDIVCEVEAFLDQLGRERGITINDDAPRTRHRPAA